MGVMESGVIESGDCAVAVIGYMFIVDDAAAVEVPVRRCGCCCANAGASSRRLVPSLFSISTLMARVARDRWQRP